MANGLMNAIRHQFAMIAIHSLVFVSIRGRSCGVGNSILVSPRGEYMANGLTNAIRHQFATCCHAVLFTEDGASNESVVVVRCSVWARTGKGASLYIYMSV